MIKNFSGIFLFIIISFVSKELFYFDEEFIVVVSFFIVFTYLFQFARSLVYAELESRSNQIFEKFEKFFILKKELYINLEEYYTKRNKYLLNKFLIFLNNIIFLVNKSLINKLVSLVYNINRIIAVSLSNVIILENKYLKNRLIGNISEVVTKDRVYFFNICEDILNNTNSLNTDLLDSENFKNYF